MELDRPRQAEREGKGKESYRSGAVSTKRLRVEKWSYVMRIEPFTPTLKGKNNSYICLSSNLMIWPKRQHVRGSCAICYGFGVVERTF